VVSGLLRKAAKASNIIFPWSSSSLQIGKYCLGVLYAQISPVDLAAVGTIIRVVVLGAVVHPVPHSTATIPMNIQILINSVPPNVSKLSHGETVRKRQFEQNPRQTG
jgi:hypothetical protein